MVLITVIGPLSGAHFNPAVTPVMALRREIWAGLAAGYVAVQTAGAVLGVWVAHLMFATPVLDLTMKLRDGPAQVFSEAVATFWPDPDNPGHRTGPAGVHTGSGGALHHLGLLVYRLNLVRQSGGHPGPLVFSSAALESDHSGRSFGQIFYGPEAGLEVLQDVQ